MLILNEEKSIYRYFNYDEKIKEIENQFDDISQTSADEQLIYGFYQGINYQYRENYRLEGTIWRKGVYVASRQVITQSDAEKSYQIEKTKNVKFIKDKQEVYFALYRVDDKLVANNIEPYFNFPPVNITALLPNRLNKLIG